MSAASTESSLKALKEIVQRHWGFHSFRPLQERAMGAVLAQRDSLVVLPTGGGKSLCYQAPAVVRGGTTIVVSPLISLMKDQVDGLQACGVPAIQLDSSQTPSERAAYERDIMQGNVRLLFVSPERLVMTDFYQLLRRIDVQTFAIDEAHCISHWGHDFRPEYRQLSRLRDLFPRASLHAYTATATERVRGDIIEQLCLKDPEVLVGNFDRPNLTYRVLPRHDLMKQTLDVIDRHPGEAGIIYCIRRRDVDELTEALNRRGCKALPYHAGLSPEIRKSTQDAFAAEQCDLVVATVAFGMGIDRSNIRFVLHTGMPKSVEHYQQETGRAGRDGLEAECVLLYSGADSQTWRYLIEKSASEPGVDASFVPSAMQHIQDMERYCRGALCRHRALVQYFGQSYLPAPCAACDLCLGDTEEVADALVVAQKILSCVARVKGRFGIGHIIDVLRGSDTDKVRKFGHERLSTFGLLRDAAKADLRDWVYQLIGQGALAQEDLVLSSGERVPILQLNPTSWEVMKGQRTVRLVQLVRRKKGAKPEKSSADTTSWEGVDRGLFEALRDLRRQAAQERHVPAYVIVSDTTLRELARIRPSSLERMRVVYGIGDTRLRDLGQQLLHVIDEHSSQRGLTRDCPAGPTRSDVARPVEEETALNLASRTAFDLFAEGRTIDAVMQLLGRARSTVCNYLAEYIRRERPASIKPWVKDDVYHRVAAAARRVGTDRLKPIYIALGEQVPYDEIRWVVNHLLAGQESRPPSDAQPG